MSAAFKIAPMVEYPDNRWDREDAMKCMGYLALVRTERDA